MLNALDFCNARRFNTYHLQGAVGIGSQSHVRQMRKGSPEQIVLNIDTESERLISPNESDDKGLVNKQEAIVYIL